MQNTERYLEVSSSCLVFPFLAILGMGSLATSEISGTLAIIKSATQIKFSKLDPVDSTVCVMSRYG